MKKILSLLLCLVLFVGLLFVPVTMNAEDEEKKDEEKEREEVLWDGEPAPFHIGVVTGTVSQSEDDLRGAEELIKRYGDSADGGMITHITYPDNFMSEQETTISQIVGLADDPDLKAIVVNQAVPGTAAAFAEIREFRDDIMLLAGEPHDDPKVIEPVSDFVVGADNVNRGYLIPLAAQKLGAKKFVHVSFPRHMSYQMLSLRRTIMKEACKDLGIEFFDETAPDPTSDIGVPGAQQFILEHMDDWVKKYGKDTCFFCTNDAQTEPLLKKVAELGAIFVEADLPSPLMGYPGAFGIELKDVAGDWPAILKRVEESVVKAGGGDRMGTWAFSYGFSLTAALGEFAKRTIEGEIEKDEDGNYKPEDVFACFEEYTPGATWKGALLIDNADPENPVEVKNHLLVYQDDYIFGKGYLHIVDEEVPDKYRYLTNEPMEGVEDAE